MTGAVATIAVLPHTAEPTAISSPSRPSIRTKRAAIRTMTNDSDIVTRISPVAGSPIRAISPRLSRAPSRTMPKRRTRCEANARPGRNGPSRGPAIAATTIPSRRAIVTSATIEGRNSVTRRATAATAIAAARPGAIDRAAARSRRAAGQDGARFGVSLGLRRFPLDAGTASQGSKVNSGAPATRRTRWNSRV